MKNGLIWNQALLDGEATTANEFARANNVSDRYVASAIKLAFLSPSIIERIFKGDIPSDISLNKIMNNFSFDWDEQEKLFQ